MPRLCSSSIILSTVIQPGWLTLCGFEKGMTEGEERLIVFRAAGANQSIPEPWFGGYTHTMRSGEFPRLSLLLPYEKKKS